MTTTPNKNSVPSEDYANMRFNAGKLDEFITSSASSYIDRLGVTHLTVTGIQQSVSGALIPANNLSDVQSAATSRANLGATTIGNQLFTATSAANARTAILAAARGANADITSLTGLTTPLSTSQGGTGNTAGLAATATALATARTFSTNLSSTTGTSFDGTANVTPGVTGTLAITNGGTGGASAVAARASLGAAASTGVADASSAAAGQVGEVITATTSATAITNAAITQAATVTLTAGDWDVSGVVRFNTSTAPLTAILAGLTTTAGGITVFPQGFEQHLTYQTSTNQTTPHIRFRFNVSASTVVYLNAQCLFGSGTVTIDGFIFARRIR